MDVSECLLPRRNACWLVHSVMRQMCRYMIQIETFACRIWLKEMMLRCRSYWSNSVHILHTTLSMCAQTGCSTLQFTFYLFLPEESHKLWPQHARVTFIYNYTNMCHELLINSPEPPGTLPGSFVELTIGLFEIREILDGSFVGLRECDWKQHCMDRTRAAARCDRWAWHSVTSSCRPFRDA